MSTLHPIRLQLSKSVLDQQRCKLSRADGASSGGEACCDLLQFRPACGPEGDDPAQGPRRIGGPPSGRAQPVFDFRSELQQSQWALSALRRYGKVVTCTDGICKGMGFDGGHVIPLEGHTL